MHIVWNSLAGSARRYAALRGRFAHAHNVTLHDPSEQRVSDLLKTLTDQDTLVIAGGDGTIHRVVNDIYSAKSNVTLGILPLGTGNDLARSLGINLDAEQAAQNLLFGRIRQLDLVELVVKDDSESTARYIFINLATGGNSEQINATVTQEIKDRWGPLCYVRGAIGALGNLQPFEVMCQIDGAAAVPLSVWNVIVANGRTAGGGMNVAPRANPTDGKLDAILISAGDLIDFAELSTQFVMGDYLDHPAVTYKQINEISLAFDPPTAFSVDGESIKGRNFAFRLIPKAINVLVGEGFES
jgi:diacylglycerol kinase (ATP)